MLRSFRKTRSQGREPDGEVTGADRDSTSESQAAEDVDGDRRPRRVARFLGLRVLPVTALLLALAAGWLKWQSATAASAELARIASVQAATESTVAMLSYQPDTAQKDLNSVRDRLTGQFRDSYTSLINDMVIPGAKEKQVSAVASIPAAALMSASDTHAVVLLYVNQTLSMGKNPPTNTASSVRVTLDKVGDRWLISAFDPV
jgi:Mce-associated membrane protein